MVGLVDLPRYMAVMAEFVAPAMKAQRLSIDAPKLSLAPAKSYVGFALTLRPQHGSGDLWVPAPTVGEIRRIIERFQPSGSSAPKAAAR